MIKCVKVDAKDDYTIHCILSDGRIVEYVVTDIQQFDTEIVRPLKDKEYFKKVFLDAGHEFNRLVHFRIAARHVGAYVDKVLVSLHSGFDFNDV